MSYHPENQYLDIMRRILAEGVFRGDRTGTGTYSIFAPQMRFDLRQGFPLLTTKKLAFGLIVSELIWMLKGDMNTAGLHQYNNHIWDEWADEFGELGPVYGAQWRSWRGHKEELLKRWRAPEGLVIDDDGNCYYDQIKALIEGIKRDPYGRRHIVTAWNPAETHLMALPPCHMFFQCYVADGRLSLHMYQRSADWFIGVPFNIASYALLTHLIARECGLEVGEFVHSFGDAHVYSNHLDQAKEQLKRAPRPMPDLAIHDFKSKGIFGLSPEHIKVIDYDAAPHIKADVAV